jgi:zinc transporter, ZIP family
VTRKAWLAAIVPLGLLAALVSALVTLKPAERLRPEGMPAVERLRIDRATLADDGIRLSVMNDGPDPVTIAQVTVDDAYWAFTIEGSATLRHLARTTVHVPYPWVQGEAHLVKLLTSTGTPFEHEIAVAVETPRVTGTHLAAFAMIGLYVGVLPVAIGLCWFPVLARLGRTGLDAAIALTIGLLAFLLVDATREGLEGASTLADSFQGIAMFTGASAAAFLGLEVLGQRLRAARARRAEDGAAGGAVLALLIAMGIGLHNFGEGLAIGAAFALGEAALGTLLIVGFTLHNTTEGLAILAPIAKQRAPLRLLIKLGLIGGVPTIAGTWFGGFVFSQAIAVLCLGLGAGAIAQVLYQLAKQLAGTRPLVERFATLPVMGGLAAGFMVMYATGMLVG